MSMCSNVVHGSVLPLLISQKEVDLCKRPSIVLLYSKVSVGDELAS